MTMMMTSSQFGLEDMEALLWGPSFPMADPMDSIFVHPDQDEQRGENSFEGNASPASPLNSSLSCSSSPPAFYSPPPSPPTIRLHGDKPGSESDLLSIPWLDHSGQLRRHAVSDDSKENVFGDLGWMDEKEFDFDSLIGSCSPSEDSPSSPEDLLASLDCSMEFNSYPVNTLSSPVHTSPASSSLPEMIPSVHSTTCPDNSAVPTAQPASPFGSQEVPSTPLCVPEPQEELEIKSEPASPAPTSPAYTLDLGSEVDVSESEVEVTEVKPVVPSVIPQIPRFVVSLSPTRIVLVLAPREELGISTTTVTTTTVSDAPEPCPASRASRSRPYPEPKHKSCPSPPRGANVKVKSTTNAMEDRVQLKAPRDKKIKKMEQNKTAATRYRQKKRAEQEALLDEHAILERKNMELTEKAESMAREIQYLKELMEEVRLTRIKKGLSADP